MNHSMARNILRIGSFVAAIAVSKNLVPAPKGDQALHGILEKVSSTTTVNSLNTFARTQFPGTMMPAGWKTSGSPWIINDGAFSPATGDYGTILYYKAGATGVSTLDQVTIRARVELTSTSSVFALCTQGVYGTIAEVDGVKNVLRYYLSWSGGPPKGILGTVSIPFALKAGRQYWITLTKTLGTNGEAIEHRYTLALTDALTQESISYPAFFAGGVTNWPGHMWGAPGVMFRFGKIKVREFIYGSPFPLNPRLWIGGDSFVEGDSIYASKDRRFAQQVFVALDGNAVISGGGGATSADLLARLPMDLGQFKPKYCLVLIGTNDEEFDKWLGNIRAIISYVKSKEAVLILGTLAPRDSRQPFLNRANAWIMSSGYPYIDFAAALSSNRDRVTWNPAFAIGDGVHPNLAGHSAMVAQMRIDAPFLFESDTGEGHPQEFCMRVMATATRLALLRPKACTKLGEGTLLLRTTSAIAEKLVHRTCRNHL